MEILVYVTDNRERVLGADCLVLYLPDEEERTRCIADLGKALRADVVMLASGDQVLVRKQPQ